MIAGPAKAASEKPALFPRGHCYVARPMSRFSMILSAVVVLAAADLFGQATPIAALNPAPTPVAVQPASAANPNALKWDAETKEYHAKAGDLSAAFTFTVTNVSSSEVAINRLSTSCGCTVAQLPTTPYKLAPGSNVSINVTMDLRGKFGQVTKTVNVDSTAGFKALLVKADIPQPQTAAIAGPRNATAAPAVNNAMADRAKNIQNALADRQAVFKGDCAKCHVDKAAGKMGAELYASSCGICHEAQHRAAMVPDLKVARTQRDVAFWQKWIMEGKPGTLMPAFAQAHGGPLTQEQIDSLTIYLYQTMPKNPQSVASTPVPPSVPAVHKN